LSTGTAETQQSVAPMAAKRYAHQRWNWESSDPETQLTP